MKYIEESILDDLVSKVENIPDKYIINITRCGECENYDTSWTERGSGYCYINDSFWRPYEFCSRADRISGGVDDG